jgi:hypothetical protein
MANLRRRVMQCSFGEVLEVVWGNAVSSRGRGEAE